MAWNCKNSDNFQNLIDHKRLTYEGYYKPIQFFVIVWGTENKKMTDIDISMRGYKLKEKYIYLSSYFFRIIRFWKLSCKINFHLNPYFEVLFPRAKISI